MSVLIAIAPKSLLIAGLTLGLLKLMTNRSAAERSWVAHIGLLALVIMAFAQSSCRAGTSKRRRFSNRLRQQKKQFTRPLLPRPMSLGQ